MNQMSPNLSCSNMGKGYYIETLSSKMAKKGQNPQFWGPNPN